MRLFKVEKPSCNSKNESYSAVPPSSQAYSYKMLRNYFFFLNDISILVSYNFPSSLSTGTKPLLYSICKPVFLFVKALQITLFQLMLQFTSYTAVYFVNMALLLFVLVLR